MAVTIWYNFVMSDSISPFPSFGHWLKRLRAQQDLTQEALAELAYCSVQTIRFFESGKRRPSVAMAERLAQVLQVPTAQLAAFTQLARRPLSKEGEVASGEPTTLADDDERDAARPLSPAPTPLPAITVALPPVATVLIGREGECNVLIRLLGEERQRLVTLVGAGGMGKTRLALAAATALTPYFADGAAFVALTPLQTPAQLSTAVADVLAIGLKGASDGANQLLRWLAPRQLLIVLDNFEQLLEADAMQAIDWVKALLAGAPNVQLLITSRERLRMRDERIFELDNLTLPGPTEPVEASEAVLLFLERAQQVSPDFTLNEENKAAVVRICRLVNGMPLGIELAAAWVRVLSCDEIADEMTRSLDFLVRTDRDVNPRHHSMRAVFDSSWRLLAPAEQAVAARLSVLRGHFSRAAAQAVAQATLPHLATLIDKSLLRVATQVGAVGTSGVRYEMHELLRQYLTEQLVALGESQQIQQQHARYFTEVAAAIDPYLYTHMTPNWRRQMALEQNNFYAVLQWALTEGHDPDLGLRLAGLLGRFWEAGSTWKEGRQWLQRALAKSQDTGALRARALVKLAELQHILEELPAAEVLLREGLAIWQALQDTPNIAYSLFQLGKIMASRNDYPQAIALLQESLALYRQVGDQWGVASLLNQLAASATHQGDYAKAEVYLDEALPLMQTMQQRPTIGVASNLLGRALLGQGEIERALAQFERAMQIFREEEAPSGIAWTYINLALTYLQGQDWPQARHYFQECFNAYRKLESKGGMMAALEGLAAIAAQEKEPVRAVQFLAVAARWRAESGQQLTELELNNQAQARALTASALSPAAWQRAWESTQHWSVAQVAQMVVTGD